MQNPINVQKPAFTKGPFSIAVELIIDGAIGPDLGPDFRFFDHSASRFWQIIMMSVTVWAPSRGSGWFRVGAGLFRVPVTVTH